MIDITLDNYFGPHAGHPDITPEIRSNASVLLSKVNHLYAMAAADGIDPPANPATGCLISGNGNGGFRPRGSSVGASSSTHKTGHGVDRHDPRRALARWCLQKPHALEYLGLWMEDPRWTPTWLHLQDVPPKSGRLVYIPSQEPPLIAALPEQLPTTRTA